METMEVVHYYYYCAIVAVGVIFYYARYVHAHGCVFVDWVVHVSSIKPDDLLFWYLFYDFYKYFVGVWGCVCQWDGVFSIGLFVCAMWVLNKNFAQMLILNFQRNWNIFPWISYVGVVVDYDLFLYVWFLIQFLHWYTSVKMLRIIID